MILRFANGMIIDANDPTDIHASKRASEGYGKKTCLFMNLGVMDELGHENLLVSNLSF
jgi:hypothetical protein